MSGTKLLPEDKKRNYKNRTYVRLAMYPKTRDAIKKKAKRDKETMVDWLDKKVQEM